MAANSYKVLGQTNPTTANTESILYTVPSGFMAFASVLSICNQGATTSTVRVAVRPAGITSTAKTFILFDTYINPNDSLILTLGLSLATTDIVSVWSATTSFSFVLSGSEIVVDTTNVQSVYNIATSSTVGMMRPDNTSVGVNNGILSLIPGGSFTLATSSNFGAVRPDNTSILITSGVISANISVASSSIAGIVRPDGTSILVTSGVISANIQTGSSSAAGIVRADGTSIFVTSGVISAISLGVNQTWTDVTASRTAGTTYTNNTGRPIMLKIYAAGSGTTQLTVTVSGLTFYTVNLSAGGSWTATETVVVPAGGTYSATTNVSLVGWYELR